MIVFWYILCFIASVFHVWVGFNFPAGGWKILLFFTSGHYVFNFGSHLCTNVEPVYGLMPTCEKSPPKKTIALNYGKIPQQWVFNICRYFLVYTTIECFGIFITIQKISVHQVISLDLE
jgi:hypothetical protein